ncbi:MAG: (Fe-S)-binding protein [Candidatus Helarchaeota archaeon]
MTLKKEILFEKSFNSCTECRACEKTCSIFQALKNYSPLDKLKAAKRIFESDEKPSNWEEVFLCTKCEACQEVCPEGVPIIDIIDKARGTCVEKWGIQYPRQESLIKNILDHGNPFGIKSSRTAWLEERLPKSSKTLFHVGCMISYYFSSVGSSLVKLLKKLNVDFTIAEDEFCCGFFVFNTGDHETAKKIIEKNNLKFEKYDKIITACTGCYYFLKQKYPIKDKVVHVSEVIWEHLKDKSLKEHALSGSDVTYHDSCHVVRPFGLIETPRKILKKMQYNIVEPTYSKGETMCCGADGGMRIINPSLALEIAAWRLDEINSIANVVFTACPFCIHHFREVVNKKTMPLEVKDLYIELEKLL